MKRPSSDRAAKACKRYIDANNGRSELSGSRSRQWLEVHHIYGRGRPDEHDWFCNLILLSKEEHNHLHDCSPAVMEVECLWAKWQKHATQLDPSSDPEYMDWNPEALSKICGCVNLLGRLEGMIRPKLLMISEDVGGWDSIITKCDELIAELTQSA
jgi:hypothetical protein